MACNNSPRNHAVSAVAARCLRCHTCCHSVAARGSTVAAVVTGFAPYLSACGSVTTKFLLRVIKIKKNEKIGNIERGRGNKGVSTKSAATLPHITPENFVTTAEDEEPNLSEQSNSEERVERANGGVWLFVKGIGSLVGTEEEIPASWGVKECAEYLRGER